MEFKFKRLLFLGATDYQLPAIKKAKYLGCNVITLSNDLSQIGHSYSDLSLNISTIDKEKVLEAAKKYKIDAIMTYAANAAVETVSYVAKELNLPGNPMDAALILQDKGLFRNLQKKLSLPHPDFRILKKDDNPQDIFDFLKHNELIVKPVDSGGSRGQTFIKVENEIEAAFQNALECSTLDQVIFEEKIDSKVLELDGDVFFQNGKLEYALYGHNYFKIDTDYNVPVGEIFPGKISNDIKQSLDEQFQAIITSLNLESGCMNFDGLVSDNEVHIIDIALRNGGNFVPRMIEFASGFDMTEAAVYAAFGVNYQYKIKKDQTPIVSYILNSSENGLYNGYTIDSKYIDNVIFEHQIVEVGDEVEEFKIGTNTLGVVAFKFNTIDEAVNFTTQVQNVVTLSVDTKKKAKGTAGFRVSSFIKNKLDQAIVNNDVAVENVLKRQFYVASSPVNKQSDDFTLKHYEASSLFEYEGKKLLGLERLYKRVLIVEPILQCLANCRHCLRQFYSPFALSDEDLSRVARCISGLPDLADIRELLITGGDPLLVPTKLIKFLDELDTMKHNIKIVRIASRIPIHNPSGINDNIIALFKRNYSFRIEMATQINHSAELFPEVRNAFEKIRNHVNIYNQTVLLNDINTNKQDLMSLCDDIRYMGIDNHYIFHCVPIKGADDFRNTVDDSINLIRQITTSGYFSGRSKPELALMTDVGKITLYENSILERKNEKILLQTYYNYEDRLRWNPYWELPESTTVDENGYLRVWYKDKNKND
ncbi:MULTISPECIES: hypothetical protein [unclassified Oceanispirochaeta]|uniref:hypothetical protein n=1 Tax=unclassified Oceanispirochaeta TaxID=2635722 RepID=UPI000E09AB1C|nr:MULTISPECIES: hypothetical protein [unclassified Oceanispirochaeta]MBF9018676.1 hypothetical protein [Oceanispirochaeta sp. M2]NPD75114.1 hypothetical protein [Oceanispirochaeta sp. M1]RDG29038.1 hypothetical protein DV872_23745 [Oceanispirochaeta sp. M1]